MIANTDGGVTRRATKMANGLIGPEWSGPSAEELDSAVSRCHNQMLADQHPDGYWVGELEGDSILESEYLLLMAFLGRERDELCVKLGKCLFDQQLEDGGWAIYPGGPVDVSASVKAYFALKILGMPVEHPAMLKAKGVILDNGGAQACNSFTRFYLALLGQISYDDCASVPVELLMLPKKTPFGLYAMSSWTRKMVVTLSIISAKKPVRKLPESMAIPELFRDDLPTHPSRWIRPLFSWSNFFLCVDKALKVYEKVAPESFRRPAVRRAHRWVLDHLENSDGLGAIFPPMIYTVIVLKCLGYDDKSPLMSWAIAQLEDLVIQETDSAWVQPCVSPVWDTAIMTIALADSGMPAFHPALFRSVRWLLDKEVRSGGDWQIRRPDLEPSGWYFEFNNEQFPDIDDTAMVLMALNRTALTDDPRVVEATRRATAWLLAMQNRDGGFAAFDVDIDNEVLTKVPFADHNAMLDPSCADITARVIESLGALGYRKDHPAVARGLEFLWKTQEPQGCWYGRWGVNYIYGTWQVLVGLKAIDYPMDEPRLRKAADWLEAAQQANGGWGETCESYDDPSLMGKGTTTASQTAWGVMGLIAAGRAKSEAVRRGVRYLMETQNADGTWDESEFTGTGFPRVFYLRYHMYRLYFPLMALGRYQQAAGRASTPALATRIPALPHWRDV